MRSLNFSAGNQCAGQAEAPSQFFFPGSHFAIVGFMVISGEVQQAVQKKNLQFDLESMPELGRLALGGIDGDGKIAGDRWLRGRPAVPRPRPRGEGGKGQYIGSLIDAAKFLIQFADFPVRGEQHRDLARNRYGFSRPRQKWPEVENRRGSISFVCLGKIVRNHLRKRPDMQNSQSGKAFSEW